MLTSLQSGPLGQQAVLVALGVGERLVGRGEDRRRVGQRFVKEEAVEVVAQVVVGGDVLARLVMSVATDTMDQRTAQLGRHAPPTAGQAEVSDVECAQAQQADQVRAGPQAVHVGLAGGRRASQQYVGERPRIVNEDLGAQRGIALTEDPSAAVGKQQAQLAMAQPAGGGEGRPPGDTLQQRVRDAAQPSAEHASRNHPRARAHRTAPCGVGATAGSCRPVLPCL
ncbi:hypothetical protein BH24CHL6_BH24CHL6_11480 [soil metagenome]